MSISSSGATKLLSIRPKALRAARPQPSCAPRFHPINISSYRLSSLQIRLLSTEVRAAIDKAVGSAPVVLFMKGTPETPQCGFSRATVQILGIQGVDPKKFAAFNVLEDEHLRAGKDIPGKQSLLES